VFINDKLSQTYCNVF